MRTLKVKWVVISGGEPLLHSGLPALCRLLRHDGIRVTLLTAGLNLEQHATIATVLDDLIVSIDGPPDVHDEIRGVPGAYRKLARGIDAVRRVRPDMPVNGRYTVQKRNCRQLRNAVGSAHTLGLNSLSFLAADLTSTAFNRPEGWSAERGSGIALTADEIVLLDREIEKVIQECAPDLERGFIVERPEKLRRIARHFRAYLGMVSACPPRCNAPWVSTVIEADGSVKPCFFHAAIGNIHDLPLIDILNSEVALGFRQHLDVSTNPTCRNCVCPLFLPHPVEA
jgi:MoaA/NifB/PqqE/SkfB family radical SAM enzyme